MVQRTVDGDVAAGLRLNVLHRFHLLAEGPTSGLEGHQLIVLAGETGQVILQLLHTTDQRRELLNIQTMPSLFWLFRGMQYMVL